MFERGQKMESSFRKMRRFKQQLTEEECIELLSSEERGTLAMNGDDGYPYAIPMNFSYDKASNGLIMHSARAGYKLDAMHGDSKACFCLYTKGVSETGRTPRNAHSIVIFGKIRFIDDPDESIRLLRDFDSRFEDPDMVEKHLKREGHLAQVFILEIEHMTGKRVIEG